MVDLPARTAAGPGARWSRPSVAAAQMLVLCITRCFVRSSPGLPHPGPPTGVNFYSHLLLTHLLLPQLKQSAPSR